MRSLLLCNHNEFVSHGTLQSVQLIPPFLESDNTPNSGASTALLMISWLRKKAFDPNVNLRYYCKQPGIHTHDLQMTAPWHIPTREEYLIRQDLETLGMCFASVPPNGFHLVNRPLTLKRKRSQLRIIAQKSNQSSCNITCLFIVATRCHKVHCDLS